MVPSVSGSSSSSATSGASGFDGGSYLSGTLFKGGLGTFTNNFSAGGTGVWIAVAAVAGIVAIVGFVIWLVRRK